MEEYYNVKIKENNGKAARQYLDKKIVLIKKFTTAGLTFSIIVFFILGSISIQREKRARMRRQMMTPELPVPVAASHHHKPATSYKITTVDESIISNHGLRFTNYKFGPMISPRGNCITRCQDYIFVTWYKGGMDDRHVMLSRTFKDSGEWHHVEFPHQHVGFRGDPLVGDSHNTIAVGICPKTHSIHLLYDMHAYSKAMLPNDFFNYSYSIKGAALVPDRDWNVNLFYPKQNYLNPECQYQRVTYPGFMEHNHNLLVKWRVGGDKRANMYISVFDGDNWSKPYLWNQSDSYGIYGDFSFSNNKMHMVFARRTKDDENSGYKNNRGIYYSYSENGSFMGPWFNIHKEMIRTSAPIYDIGSLKILDPSQPGDVYNSPSFIETEDGVLHFVAHIKQRGSSLIKYYCKSVEDGIFQQTNFHLSSEGNLCPIGGNFKSIGNILFLIYLENGKVIILSAPSSTGKFQIVYQQPQDNQRRYRDGQARLWKDSTNEKKWHLYLYLMVERREPQDQQPLHMLHLLLMDSAVVVSNE